MMTLDELFRGPADSLSHPRLKNWKSRLAQADTKATLTLYRPEAGFGLTQTDMNLQFVKDGELQPLETVDWDDDLNTGLIQLGGCPRNSLPILRNTMVLRFRRF